MRPVHSSNPLSRLLFFFSASLQCIYVIGKTTSITSPVDESRRVRVGFAHPPTTQLLHISTRKKKRINTTKPLNSIDLQTFSSRFFFPIYSVETEQTFCATPRNSSFTCFIFVSAGNYSDANCRNNILQRGMKEMGDGAGRSVSTTDSINVAHREHTLTKGGNARFQSRETKALLVVERLAQAISCHFSPCRSALAMDPIQRME